MSVSSVYRHRTRSAAFRTRWEDALAEGVVTLRTLLLDRAINGVERPVWHGGKQVGVAREWSDRLALALLAAHERRVAPTDPAAAAPLGDEAVAAELAARLAEMNLRLGGEG